MTKIDESYAGYQPELPAGSDLARLTAKAEAQVKAAAEVTRLEAELAKAREVFKDIAERELPEMMEAATMAEFKTSTGLVIKVAEVIRASIPQALAPRAFAWLRQHGHAALIKRGISTSFGKGEDEKADEFLALLAEKGFEADDKTSVHPSTLSSFVKEKLRDGEEIPLDLLGVHRQRVAKVE